MIGPDATITLDFALNRLVGVIDNLLVYPSAIQKNLDETRDVLHGTIESVLQRGEKLEDLVERSGELSAQSKLFYKQAKRANSCCAVV